MWLVHSRKNPSQQLYGGRLTADQETEGDNMSAHVAQPHVNHTSGQPGALIGIMLQQSELKHEDLVEQ